MRTNPALCAALPFAVVALVAQARPTSNIPTLVPAVRRSPRLHLRPPPQRPHHLDPVPDELTGVTTSNRQPLAPSINLHLGFGYPAPNLDRGPPPHRFRNLFDGPKSRLCLAYSPVQKLNVMRDEVSKLDNRDVFPARNIKELPEPAICEWSGRGCKVRGSNVVYVDKIPPLSAITHDGQAAPLTVLLQEDANHRGILATRW